VLVFKAGHSWVKKRGKRFSNDEEVETEEWKWLRRRSKNFHACGLRSTGKVMGQVHHCWWRICREINISSRLEFYMFYVLYPVVTYLLSFPRTMGGSELDSSGSK
jgi:hypothetical protein